MKPSRITRVNEVIHRELATQLYRVIQQSDFDPARVTITHVITAVDLRTARVLVSIRGTPTEQEASLRILRANRAEFQRVLSANVPLRYTPRIQFVLDDSIAEGDHVLQLINGLQADGTIPADDDLPPETPLSPPSPTNCRTARLPPLLPLLTLSAISTPSPLTPPTPPDSAALAPKPPTPSPPP